MRPAAFEEKYVQNVTGRQFRLTHQSCGNGVIGADREPLRRPVPIRASARNAGAPDPAPAARGVDLIRESCGGT